MRTLWQDVRYGARALWKSPGVYGGRGAGGRAGRGGEHGHLLGRQHGLAARAPLRERGAAGGALHGARPDGDRRAALVPGPARLPRAGAVVRVRRGLSGRRHRDEFGPGGRAGARARDRGDGRPLPAARRARRARPRLHARGGRGGRPQRHRHQRRALAAALRLRPERRRARGADGTLRARRDGHRRDAARLQVPARRVGGARLLHALRRAEREGERRRDEQPRLDLHPHGGEAQGRRPLRAGRGRGRDHREPHCRTVPGHEREPARARRAAARRPGRAGAAGAARAPGRGGASCC